MPWATGEAPIKKQYIVDLSTVNQIKEKTINVENLKDKRGQNKPNERNTANEQKIVSRQKKLCPSFHDRNSMFYRERREGDEGKVGGEGGFVFVLFWLPVTTFNFYKKNC